MIINEQIRNCVNFIFQDVENKQTGSLERRPLGTAFYIGVPLDDKRYVAYAVTARHLIDRSDHKKPLYLRTNNKNGQFEDHKSLQEHWISNKNDVAIAPVSLLETSNIMTIPISLLATDDLVKREQFAEGDEVFFVTLFSAFYGRQNIQPIIRFGKISLMPREPLSLRVDPVTVSDIHAYLVESLSWGGQSGAPVFIDFPPDRRPGMLALGKGRTPRLLGLTHGHYEIPKDISFVENPGDTARVSMNAGIAIVIPAQEIINLINDPELESARKLLAKQ